MHHTYIHHVRASALAFTLGAVFTFAVTTEAHAAAPQAKTNAPGFYRRAIRGQV